jgi:hypothetical protein
MIQWRWFRLRLFRISSNYVALVVTLLFVSVADPCSAQEKQTDEPISALCGAQSFGVKYVSADAVYLEAGSNAGLAKGQKLAIKRKSAGNTVIGQIEIESVAASSAAGIILSGNGNINPGDVACFSLEEAEKQKLASEDARKYPQIIRFTEDDPLDREVRENLPKPPSPEVNRFRGRIGFDFGHMQQSELASSLYGLTLRIDATRLGGSYWNIRGYYRGYRHSEGRSSIAPTIIDLVNRTYHLSLSYDNPNSHWVAGAGRLFVPWASSLDTLDGVYLGRRFGKATAAVFGGSAPDPTSWDYDPHRQMAGGLVNLEAGGFESLRFTSTSGIALTRINWHPSRQFAFFQNGIFYKRYLSLYNDFQIDLINNSSPALNSAQSAGKRELAISRSYLTIRLQPFRALSFDVSHNYFRNIPTFDERLLSTGLLDKYLFQGFSGGFHLDLPYKLGIYSTVGRSHRTGDAKPSWDYLAGATAGNVLHTGMRADFRYSKFDSSFGRGIYRSLTLSRDLGESLQFDVQVGQQDISSTFTSQSRSRFITGNLNWFFRANYYVGAAMTLYRGNSENYRQSFVTLGYCFDNRRPRHK